jgi:DDE superfamily endonuclease/Helix-turn-helix of DDE superfamily endonuclease
MLSYEQVKDCPRILQSLTSLNPKEFEGLLPSFEAAWDTYVQETFLSGGRQRAYGGGRKAKLHKLEDKLLFILMYFRQYPTQEVQGFFFGMSQAQSCEWVHKLTRLLNQALGEEQQLPERDPAGLMDVLGACPSLEFMIDGTERPLQRPQDKEARKSYYSGKKKRHTVKNNVITQRGGKVLYVSDTFEGRKHDKSIADEEQYEFPEGSKLWQDSGFQGYQPEGVTVQQPQKKPRGKKLTKKQKSGNKKISKVRVEVEHQIGGIKRCQIVVQPFRNYADHYIDDVIETACGLHNYRLTQRHLKVA